VRQQMPILNDRDVQEYLESVGRRLVAAIPEQYQHREFRYSFEVVNARDLNAFALPGGPTFVNRGMIEAVRKEGELAGVMAHELSHVALRHATAQATETKKYQVGSVLDRLPCGNWWPIGFSGWPGQPGRLWTDVVKYSRKYETQADILGAQIMARAGYDPHDLANVFKLLESQGGPSGPQFLSDHPNPETDSSDQPGSSTIACKAESSIAGFSRFARRSGTTWQCATSANLLGHCEKQPQESRYREQYRLFGSVPEGRTRSISLSRFRSYSGVIFIV